MRIVHHTSYKPTLFLKENKKQALQYLKQGKISKEDFKRLAESDPTSNGKYVGWMAKILIKEKIEIDRLTSIVQEFHVFLEKGKTSTKDINAFKAFETLEKEVEGINRRGDGISVRELEKDYEVIMDTPDLYIAVPHSHEASRKLGLTDFKYRDCGDGRKDSQWCTTYKAPDHFNDYYYDRNITFYYILVRSKKLQGKVNDLKDAHSPQLYVIAIAIPDEGSLMEAYDAKDNLIPQKLLKEYLDLLGIA